MDRKVMAAAALSAAGVLATERLRERPALAATAAAGLAVAGMYAAYEPDFVLVLAVVVALVAFAA